jgi:integrase
MKKWKDLNKFEEIMQLKIGEKDTPIHEAASRTINKMFLSKSDKTKDRYVAAMIYFSKFLRKELQITSCKSFNSAMMLALSLNRNRANELMEIFRAYLHRQITRRNLKLNSANQLLAVIFRFYRVADAESFINYSVRVKRFTQEKTVRTLFLTQAEFDKFWATLEKDTSYSADRNRALLYLIYYLALRSFEALEIRWDELNLDEGYVWIRRKGRLEKEVKRLPDKCLDALRVWRSRFHPRSVPEHVFCVTKGSKIKYKSPLNYAGLVKAIHKICEGSGIRPFYPHSLRRKSITDACDAAARHQIPIESVLKHSGHTTLKQILVYRDLAKEDYQKKFADILSSER